MTTERMRTLADIPFFVSDRFPRPELVGRATAAGVTWVSGHDVLERVCAISLGLTALGMREGVRVVLLAENRPDWLWVDFAILTAGAVTTPVYATLPADQIAYILRDSEAVVAVVSTPAQLDKIASIVAQGPAVVPALKAVVVMDAPATLPAIAGLVVVTLADVASRGRQQVRDDPAAVRAFGERARDVQPSSLATLIYTSGTTGEPKGVMLTHANLVANLSDVCDVMALKASDVGLSFLPLCHAFERMVVWVYLTHGMSVAFAESHETIARDLLQVRPTVMTGVPRVFEKLEARILERGAALGGVRRAIFRWAIGVARARGRQLPEHPRLSPGLRAASWLADRLVFSKIRASLGGRLGFLVSGSAPLAPDVGRFFSGLGLPIIEGYGLTETSPVLTVTPHAALRYGAVGVPLPHIRLKIADDGEILAQGPSIMAGYYRRPAETAEVLRDGWFHTGDIGAIDADGYLRITDRKKELLVTSGGKKIAPQPIEGALRAHALVSEAVLVGDGRHYAALLLVPNFAALARHVKVEPPTTRAAAEALIARPDVRAAYDAIVAAVNRGLAQFERIKQFTLLSQEFSLATGELTPTFKVKRRVVAEKYRRQIEEIYGDAPAGSKNAQNTLA